MVKKQTSTADASEFVAKIISQALVERASDIHIEPLKMEMRIRFRVDGRLAEKKRGVILDHEPILNRIKVLANLDITNHVNTQDGHFSSTAFSDGKPIDVRVSIYPTINGEAIVLRLLNRDEMLIPLGDLGIEAGALEKFRHLINKNYGMVLVTGSAGSGKTTTLYSVLQELKSSEKNVITLEDPVEYYLEEVRQTKISTEHGLSFAQGMKSILRQDPDVVMIGEIRDHETAEHAIRAALTGKIVFSTVHSNSSVGTIARLIDMEIERSLVAYALNGVMSQRLVGKICQNCKVVYSPAHSQLKYLGLEPGKGEFFRGEGCEQCKGSGYKGRLGLFEIMEIDDTIRAMIVEKDSIEKIQAYFTSQGTRTLREDALDKIHSGLTTVEEVSKVI